MSRIHSIARVLLYVCLSTLSIAAFAQGSATCTFQPFHINAPAGVNPTPTDINDNGSFTGSYFLNNTFHGFLFTGGKFASFMFPGSTVTFAEDMNKFGTIVGWFAPTVSSNAHAFKVNAGVFTELKVPGFAGAPLIASGINEFGHIAGQFNQNGSDVAFLLRGSQFTIFNFPGSSGGTFPTSVNKFDTVIGYFHDFGDEIPEHGFRWNSGNFTRIEFPGATTTRTVKINDLGNIVGTYVDAQGANHGFVWVKGVYKTIDVPNGFGTEMIAINNNKQVLAVQISDTGRQIMVGNCAGAF